MVPTRMVKPLIVFILFFASKTLDICKFQDNRHLNEVLQDIDKQTNDLLQESEDEETDISPEMYKQVEEIEIYDQPTDLRFFNRKIQCISSLTNQADLDRLYKGDCTYEISATRNYMVFLTTLKMQDNMQNLIQQEKFFRSKFQILDIFFKLAIALKKLHDNDIVHLNLALHHILLLNDYQPVISGFNKCVLGENQVEIPFIRYKYVAPELTKGSQIKYQLVNSYFTPQDIYSLGIIFYEIFNAKELQDISQINFEQKSDLQAEKYYSIIKPMINSDPGKRPDIDEVIKSILKSTYGIINYNEADYKNKIGEESQYYQLGIQSQKYTVKDLNGSTRIQLQRLQKKLQIRKC